jgi:hypothetical protein
MNYYISVDSNNNITGRYAGAAAMPSPWISVTAAQYAALVVGSTWVDGSAVPPPAPAPTAAQLAMAAYAALIAGGLTVTSAGTPALNGVYAIDPQSQADIATEAQFIGTYSEFTNGQTTDLVWPLKDATTLVTFPTAAEFLAFAKQAAQVVSAAKLAVSQIAAGQAASLPTATASIP